jgi:GTPase SAR1 family protein
MKSDAFLLVYDITNPSSLQTLDYFMDFIKMEAEQRLEDNERLRKEFGPNPTGIQIGMPPPVKIVAGNKCDLKDGRAVTSRDGLEYARLNGCGFMETSAREMVNIEETFACTCCCCCCCRCRTRGCTRSCRYLFGLAHYTNRENSACPSRRSISPTT